MFSRKKQNKYEIALQDLSQQQLLQQILVTLERMEALLENIDANIEAHPEHPDCLETIAEMITNGIEHNTEKLSEVTLTPPKPQPTV